MRTSLRSFFGQRFLFWQIVQHGRPIFDPRRLREVAADQQSVTIQLNDAGLTERNVPYDKIDRAKTVFVWGPAPKPGKASKATREATSRKRREENQRADEPALVRGEIQ